MSADWAAAGATLIGAVATLGAVFVGFVLQIWFERKRTLSLKLESLFQEILSIRRVTDKLRKFGAIDKTDWDKGLEDLVNTQLASLDRITALITLYFPFLDCKLTALKAFLQKIKSAQRNLKTYQLNDVSNKHFTSDTYARYRKEHEAFKDLLDELYELLNDFRDYIIQHQSHIFQPWSLKAWMRSFE